MSSSLDKVFDEEGRILAVDYFWDCEEHFYWGASSAIIAEAREAAEGLEIKDLSVPLDRLVKLIDSRYASMHEKGPVIRNLLRRMKPDNPNIYPRRENDFLARELLRIALWQIDQR